jgi:hypothetical protein
MLSMELQQVCRAIHRNMHSHTRDRAGMHRFVSDFCILVQSVYRLTLPSSMEHVSATQFTQFILSVRKEINTMNRDFVFAQIDDVNDLVLMSLNLSLMLKEWVTWSYSGHDILTLQMRFPMHQGEWPGEWVFVLCMQCVSSEEGESSVNSYSPCVRLFCDGHELLL